MSLLNENNSCVHQVNHAGYPTAHTNQYVSYAVRICNLDSAIRASTVTTSTLAVRQDESYVVNRIEDIRTAKIS